MVLYRTDVTYTVTFIFELPNFMYFGMSHFYLQQ